MTGSQRKARTEQELRRAVDRLYYEFWMFIKLANGLASGMTGESILHNALLESFTMHASAILDFLYEDNPGPDDVVATDYLPAAEEWASARPKKSRILQVVHEDMRYRARMEIGQLSYEGHDAAPERQPWPFMRIAKEVDAAINKFLDLVPELLQGPRWREVRQRRQGPNNAV